jgi:chromosome segregation protein
LNSIKIESAKYETKLEDLEADIREVLDNLRQIQEEKLEEEINPETVEHQIRKLSDQYSQIGGIDPEIEKEYEETKKKYDFLYEQSSDLEETIGTLDGVIHELDLRIKEKFTTEFKTICSKFEEYFRILFGGGHAKIIKMNENDIKQENANENIVNGQIEIPSNNIELSRAEELAAKMKKLSKSSATGLSGIDIQANPPGKAVKSINVLSGGEKAMTAIALICAIISVNPSPFVVLDEIDAALDEANAERLSKIIVDLSGKTQFIIITHNRAPMHKADILYGVTMQDDGISQLLSIKLESYLKN